CIKAGLRTSPEPFTPETGALEITEMSFGAKVFKIFGRTLFFFLPNGHHPSLFNP
ncbi:unnamed protein product, partial [Allacma fusca]